MKLNNKLTKVQKGLSVNRVQFSLLNENELGGSTVDKQIDIQSDIDPLELPDPYVVSYVCLLVPRFKEHLLVGDISDQLYIWMKNLCVSFGWRLKFIDISPGHLHWVMTVSITSFPTRFMKILLQETSKKIFEDFPRFKRKNVSLKFWAPWYFVGVGDVPYSQSTIQSLINQIRREQGL